MHAGISPAAGGAATGAKGARPAQDKKKNGCNNDDEHNPEPLNEASALKSLAEGVAHRLRRRPTASAWGSLAVWVGGAASALSSLTATH